MPSPRSIWNKSSWLLNSTTNGIGEPACGLKATTISQKRALNLVVAKNVIQTCRMLLEKHKGVVPHTREELEALPGVGRKTANVVLNTAFGEATIAVDTHIFRVANRTKLATGKTPLEVEKELVKNIPEEFLQDAHHWLILHGRYTCIARKPKCPNCLIADLCEYKEKTKS
jgi:endonuclease-3